MHTIKPLSALARPEIRELARAAAERQEPVGEANPFEVGTTAHVNFEHDYLERARELDLVEV